MGLEIRKMKESDRGPLFLLLSDPEVMRFLEPPFSGEQTQKFLIDAGLSEPPLIFAAEKDGGFIGYVIFHEYDASSMEIGWVLYPSCWNRGYASGLTGQLIDKAFSMGRDAVIECSPDQEVTKHIAEKYGFRRDGIREGLEVYRLSREK